MRVFFVLVRRELESYFVSLTGYLIIALTLLLLGFSFVDLLGKLNGQPTDTPLTEVFYSTYYFWLILLLVAPVITMRLFALEKFSGTFETLMTAPVGEAEVVFGKFAGALIYYGLVWLPLLVYAWIVHRHMGGAAGFDLGTVSSTFIGILLVGAVYMAMGCFASALTRSQMVAAMVSYGLGVAWFILSLRSLMAAPMSDWSSRVFAYIAMTDHMEQFARGTIDTRPIVFYLSLTGFFLFLTVKVVQSQRWK